MLREEEIKWYQPTKVKELLEGDSNTKYFQLIANGKHRKARIYKLQDGNHIISCDEKLKKYSLHITKVSSVHQIITPMRLEQMTFPK